MMAMASIAAAALAALLPITNPVGAVAAYAALTANMPAEQMRRQAWRTGLWVFLILATFTALGSLILTVFGISLAALQIGGGIIVAHSGFGLITPRENFTEAERNDANSRNDISMTPMALPLIAGPGAIGVVIALTARHPGVQPRLGIIIAVAVVAVLIAIILRWGTPLVDKMGPIAIGALVRVMGFLILVIGVELVVHGVKAAMA